MLCATPAAVTMFMAPGPIELVATMIWRRFLALARRVRRAPSTARSGRARSAAVLHGLERFAQAVTLPWPKIANTPPNSGASAPSITVRWAHSHFTSACAIVSRIVFIAAPPLNPRQRANIARRV